MKRKLTVLAALLILLMPSGYANALNNNAEKLYKAGIELFNNEKYIEAIDEFQKVINQYPKSQRADNALFMIGKSSEEIGAYCVNENQFRSYPKLYTERYDMLKYRKYMEYIKEHRTDYRYFGPGGQYKYLGAAYKRIEEDYPESELAAAARYQIIRMRMGSWDWEGGPEKLTMSLELYEPFFKKYSKSKYIKEAIRNINHSFPSLHFYYGERVYKEPLKTAKELLSKYREILRHIEKDNNISEALLAIAKEYYEIKDYEKAEDALLELKRMYPEDKRAEEVLKTIEEELRRETLLVNKNKEEQIAILKEFLADSNPQVQEYAVEKIGNMKEPSFIPSLLKMFMDARKYENWKLQDKIRRAIQEIGEDGEEQIAELIKETNDKTGKIQIIRLGQRIKSEKIIKASIQALKKEKDADVKIALLALLTRASNPEALPVYVELINDDYKHPTVSKTTYCPIRNYAFGGILRLDKSIAVPELEKILRETEDIYNRKQAIDMLSRIDARESIELILEFRDDENLEIRKSVLSACQRMRQTKNERIMRKILPFLNDENAELRLLAVKTLRSNEKAAPYLVKMLNDDELSVRSYAAITLYKFGYSEGIINPLIEELKLGEHSKNTADEIARILGELKAEEAVLVLIDKVWLGYTYSVSVIRALGEIGDSRALPELKKIAAEENVRRLVRDEAEKSIVKIETK